MLKLRSALGTSMVWGGVSLVAALSAFSTPLTAIHPSFNMTSVRPDDFKFSIGGMDWLPNGDLLVTTYDQPEFGKNGNPADMYVLSGVQTGDKSKVTFRKASTGLGMVEPLGLGIVDGDPYVVHKHQLSKLIDANKDGIYEAKEKITTFTDIGNFHQFDYGLLYKDGFFYGTLNAAWQPQNEGADRGKFIKIEKATGKLEIISGGLRSPSGLNWGPEGEFFASDNQGEWQPANKINNLRPNRFYGMRHPDNTNHPLEKLAESPPAVWLPQSDIANSVTQPLMLRSGIYQGQLIAGDIFYGGIQRFALEKVKDEWQGAVFLFAGGFESGIFRLSYGPDGAIYAAGLGGPGGNWKWNDKKWALHRITPNDKVTFEMLAVHSRKDGLEIAFTKELDAGAANKANFSGKEWNYKAEANYGAGRNSDEPLNIESAEMSPDKKSVFLKITNLKTNRCININLSNVKSASGENTYTNSTWYTLNFISETSKFDPITPVALEKAGQRQTRLTRNFSVHQEGNSLVTSLLTDKPYELEVYDFSGKKMANLSAQGNQPYQMDVSHWMRGVYHIRIKSEGEIETQSMVLR